MAFINSLFVAIYRSASLNADIGDGLKQPTWVLWRSRRGGNAGASNEALDESADAGAHWGTGTWLSKLGSTCDLSRTFADQHWPASVDTCRTPDYQWADRSRQHRSPNLRLFKRIQSSLGCRMSVTTSASIRRHITRGNDPENKSQVLQSQGAYCWWMKVVNERNRWVYIFRKWLL